MKLFLVAVACGLTLPAPARAGEMSLNGNPTASLGFPGARSGQDAGLLALQSQGKEEAGTSLLLGAPSADSVDTLRGTGNPAGTLGWSQDAAQPGLPPAHAASTLDTTLPMIAPVNPGVSDSMIYAGLFLLSGAMLWACSGFVSRKQETSVRADWSEAPRAARPARVRMMPLKGSR